MYNTLTDLDQSFRLEKEWFEPFVQLKYKWLYNSHTPPIPKTTVKDIKDANKQTNKK